ncbi:PQQ-dependent sugar dehydrogenase [Marinicella sediminis]|uniref:PQQ-dependent sugar dehydrogenase n=1 Tax=Marinicella sediminis TaxID=1792834 RepID=A0ABV7JCN4_9GAMM|nr:PQQ-dependent sugar dehydrogenase [Marinicella sediminis]
MPIILLLITLTCGLISSASAKHHGDLTTTIQVTTYAEGLHKPWGMTFLPDGRLLVTEKAGTLRLVGLQGEVSDPIKLDLPVKHAGQGGLLDVVLDPAFSQNQWVYFSFAKDAGEDQAKTAVGKARLVDHAFTDATTIWEQRQAARGGYHFGSRLVFDRTGHLFVTTGDRNYAKEWVQDLDTHFGKIVRIDTNGKPAKDNPYINKVGALPDIYSYGHRNVQGAFLHPETGELWANEHGPKGGDEINLIKPGNNYGWPVITYGINYNGTPITDKTAMPGMEQPVHYWDPSIATSGMLIYSGKAFPEWQGHVFTGALKLMHLNRIELDDNLRVISEERLLLDQKARIRAIEQGPDGHIYVATDSDNGTILKISPKE